MDDLLKRKTILSPEGIGPYNVFAKNALICGFVQWLTPYVRMNSVINVLTTELLLFRKTYKYYL